jgi:serine/threonine protein kinase
LKPDNIFIDVANNPRIGDFGLATSGQFMTAVRSSAAADFEGDFTRSLGTTYYVAPEMKSGLPGHYNEKVDVRITYSSFNLISHVLTSTRCSPLVSFSSRCATH